MCIQKDIKIDRYSYFEKRKCEADREKRQRKKELTKIAKANKSFKFKCNNKGD
jgi:hypothetical protein